MTPIPSVCVIIPALNEAAALGKVLDAIPDWVSQIVVADNGSTDDTADIARARGADVIIETSPGYGAACLAGLSFADPSKIIVFLDADFSDHPDEMLLLVQPIADGLADLVIGSRTLGQVEKGALTLAQIFGNRLACCLIRCFWGYSYSDLGPFRAITRKALMTLEMKNQKYGWTVEMQVKALQHGLKITEVPVSYKNRIGQSKISGTITGTIKAGYGILGMVFYLFFKEKQGRL